MIEFSREDGDGGYLSVGPFQINWGPPDENFDDDPGYVTLSLFNHSLEFGLLDQDRPGIYLTKYDEDSNVVPLLTILKL